MENNEEYMDVVDENNNLTGEKIEYKKAHSEGVCHREVGAFIINNKGEILLQKRASTKKQHPDTWAICAGHVDSGETLEDGMIREIEEEIGVRFNNTDLDFGYIRKRYETFPNRINNHFSYIYFLRTDLRINDYTVQLDELSEVKYYSFEEFKNMMMTNNPKCVYYGNTEEYNNLVLQKLEEAIQRYIQV